MEHEFTQEIKIVLHSHFGEAAEDIYEKSLLLQYLTEIFDIIQNSLQNLAMTGFKIAAQRLQFRQIQCSCGVIFKIRPETADFGGYIENSPGFGSTIHAGLQLSVRRSSCSLAADFRKLDPCWCGFAQTAVSKNRRKRSFGNDPQIYQKFPLNLKTRSATRGSKARGSFANLYALYVLIEDYLYHGFDREGNYASYQGAKFTDLFKRQRELPFGSKLQNHALNHRMNEEFRKYFPQAEYIPILRDVETNRYWINENLLKIAIAEKSYNIAAAIITIIDRYVETKRKALEAFIQTCERLKEITRESETTVEGFIMNLLAPNVDARLFEIVSYAILKYYYSDQTVYFGFDLERIEEENLKLYKTGRTNANDGGIDFVMRPLGRFFQVTETLDVKKYFLDIDKIERYPISFVIKSEELVKVLRQRLKEGAEKQYSVEAIVRKYMNCIEEIINIPILKDRFNEAVQEGHLQDILDEIIKQSKVEFNYEEPDSTE